MQIYTRQLADAAFKTKQITRFAVPVSRQADARYTRGVADIGSRRILRDAFSVSLRTPGISFQSPSIVAWWPRCTTRGHGLWQAIANEETFLHR